MQQRELKLMNEQEIINNLAQSVLEYDKEKAAKVAKEAIKIGMNPVDAIEKGLGNGIRVVGEKFNLNEVYLPHVVMAAEAMQAASDVLLATLSKEEAEKISLGTIVLGTVKGDIHDIGKSLVSTMLSAAGFKVIDIGVDVPIFDFIRRAMEANADVIAMSALMTTTIAEQRDLIEELKRKGGREKFKVLVGGGAVNKEWANEIGANAYGCDMKDAVEVAKRLVERS